MPAAKKRKASVATSSARVERKVEKMSEQMQMLMVVFALAMIMFAAVLYYTYAR